jgi:Protein of unknown function (DUF2934)
MPTAPKKRTPAVRRAAATRTAAAVAADVSFPTLSHDAIAVRAYELFLRRGAQHGQDWDDWLTAERELQP